MTRIEVNNTAFLLDAALHAETKTQIIYARGSINGDRYGEGPDSRMMALARDLHARGLVTLCQRWTGEMGRTVAQGRARIHEYIAIKV